MNIDSKSKKERYWHIFFIISLWFKLFSGIFELGGAGFVAMLNNNQIEKMTSYLSERILGTGIKDIVYLQIVYFLNSFDNRLRMFVVIYLLIHAIVKIVLVICIFKKKIWAYKWMIIVLFIFIFYQVYEMINKFSMGLLILTIIDIFVIILTRHEYEKYKSKFSDQEA